MSFFIQLAFNSLIAGSTYALVASGFSLIYGTNKFINFAHGISVVIASYVLYLLYTMLGANFFISVILTLIITIFFGLATLKFIYSPLQKRKASNVILLIASLAILIIFQNLIQLFFSPNVKSINYIKTQKGIEILGAYITPLQISIVIISILLFVGLFLFMKKTKLGRNMRAVADNKELAKVIGINEQRIAEYSFVIGSLLAGIAGILIGLEQYITPTMGTNLVIKGFTGSIIGGIISVPASILGSYILGFAENYGVWFISSSYKEAISFILLFIFLLFKPTGLFGTNNGGKK